MREMNAQKYDGFFPISDSCEAADAGSIPSLVLFVHWISVSSAPFYYNSENL